MTELHVYVVDEACWSCDEARRLVAEVAPLMPQVQIELRDLNDTRRPSAVFAVPTYVLEDRIVYLGNPTSQELMQMINAAL